MSGHGRTVRGLVCIGALAVAPLLAAPLLTAPAGASAPAPAASTGTPTATATARPVCAISELAPAPVLTPTTELTHPPGTPTIGGEGLAGNGLSVPAGSPPLPAGVAASSWLVADLDTGEVLGACGAHRMLAPASIQKLLLVATVMPKLNPVDPVVIAPEDLDFGAEWDSKTVPLQVGATYTVQDLFLGLLLRSGNDAANALARVAGGDRGKAGTIADMNAEARRLGAWDTHAETPSGLDGPGQVSSAYDMALIFRACFASADFRAWVDSPLQQLTSGLPIEHDNWEFVQAPGVLGGKAGFTDTARHTFVGAGERDGRRLVATVLGAEAMPARGWQQALGLLDWGFAVRRGTSVGHLVQPGEADAKLAQAGGTAPTVRASGTAAAPVTPAPNLRAVVASFWVAAIVGVVVLLLTLARRRRSALAAANNASIAITTASSDALTQTPTQATTPTPTPTSDPTQPPDQPPDPPPDRPLMGQPPPN